MATDVIMPKVDMDQESGTIVRWLKNDGDEVKQGETILEIETDKVAIDVEAPAAGILANIQYDEGATVPIATVIATILAPGETLPPATQPPQAEETASTSGNVSDTPRTTGSGNGVPITPVARNFAQASGVDLSTVTGTGPRGKVTR
ncbi:MAG: E3 binding domain-containing protein, partial [Chloroflexota bacterium]